MSSTVTIRSAPLLLMANYSKNKKAESSQELHCNYNRRRLELRGVSRCRRDSEKTRKVGKRDRKKVWWRQCTWEQDDSRSLPLSTVHEKAWEPFIAQRRIPGVGLEEQGVVTKCSGEVLPHHFGLTIFGNLEVFFVSFSLVSHCFVIL